MFEQAPSVVRTLLDSARQLIAQTLIYVATFDACGRGTASGGGDVRFYGGAPQFTANESPGGHVSMEGR